MTFDDLDNRRRELGVTKDQWAKAAGFTGTNIDPWYRGRVPREASLLRLSLALDMLAAVKDHNPPEVLRLSKLLREAKRQGRNRRRTS